MDTVEAWWYETFPTHTTPPDRVTSALELYQSYTEYTNAPERWASRLNPDEFMKCITFARIVELEPGYWLYDRDYLPKEYLWKRATLDPTIYEEQQFLSKTNQ